MKTTDEYVYDYESTVDIMEDVEWKLQNLGEFKGTLKVIFIHDDNGSVDDED